MPEYRVHHCIFPAREIFGSVGRSGGGYNTVWTDWSDHGRQMRDIITREYEEAMNQLCGHYSRLEASMLREGMRNPIIVTCGPPRRRTLDHLPPEIRNRRPAQIMIMESLTGGSRLWVAQKHDMAIPILVNDWTGRFQGMAQLTTIAQVREHFQDQPRDLQFDRRLGLIEGFDQGKIGHHLGAEWSEDRLVPLRAPIWISIMNRHGYRIDRLPPLVQKILADAGIDQTRLGQ